MRRWKPSRRVSANSAKQPLRDGENDLTFGLFRGYVAPGLCGFAERVNTANKGLELAGFDEEVELLEASR